MCVNNVHLNLFILPILYDYDQLNVRFWNLIRNMLVAFKKAGV